MKEKLPKDIDPKTVGLVMRYDQQQDSTTIVVTVEKGLKDCMISSFDNIFKDDIYQEENFKKLFSLDSAFYRSQPTLTNLKQLLVVQTKIIRKKDDNGKNSIGAEFYGKWITTAPLKLISQFYYVEKTASVGAQDEDKTVLSYLSGQILVKLCHDIRANVFKNK